MQSFRKQIAAIVSKKPWVGNRYPRWQRLLCAGFAFLFTLVLPFICFGAFAEPGHPHRMPHFVFAEPVLSVDLLLEAQPPLPQMMNHEGHAMAMPPEHVVNPKQQQPVGRSASSLILFSILVLTSLGVWVLSRVDQRHIVEFSAALSFESATLAIPLPPPRSTVSVL